MKSFRWRILTVLAALGVGFFLLWPTWRYYGMSEVERENLDPNELAVLKSQAVRLGLDLQGGMHLVLEIDDSEIGPEADTADLLARALEVVRNRIDEFGVTEPVVQGAGDRRIIVELAGIDDPERAEQIISRAAILEFQMVRSGSEMRRLAQQLDSHLARLGGVAAPPDTSAPGTTADTAAADITAPDAVPAIPPTAADLRGYLAQDVTETSGSPLTSRIVYTQRRGTVGVNEVAHVRETDTELLTRYIALLDSTGAIPSDVELVWEAEPTEDATGNAIRMLYLLTRAPELTGEVLEDARPQPDTQSSMQGNYLVEFDLSRTGRRLFSRTTGENVGRLMAIVLDGKVKSAPEIQDKIRAGTAVITGRFTPEEAKDLAVVLKAGALPVPIKIEEKRAVGPSLGQDSIEQGRTAMLIGFMAVLVFMVVYYRAAGLIAVFALSLNLVLLLAAMVALDAVLTLPGIAGFVLTAGMSVDANVLIYERMREELRNGQTFRNALSRGYDRAFTTILDSNVTTLMSGLALLWFGTGPIKGFAVVLSIGIVVSMFTALFVTRLIFDLLTRPGGVRQVSV
ncbi:MAG: protein translocase subunit SecD [Candidatus Eiseniibacteriota bacterium]